LLLTVILLVDRFYEGMKLFGEDAKVGCASDHVADSLRGQQH
jgi:hypothetical protein